MAKKVTVKAIKSASGLKILSISGQPEDFLINHKVDHPAVLLMRRGSVLYKQDGHLTPLSEGDHYDIPADIFHKVTCTTNAQFFVIMSDVSKMQFKKKPE